MFALPLTTSPRPQQLVAVVPSTGCGAVVARSVRDGEVVGSMPTSLTSKGTTAASGSDEIISVGGTFVGMTREERGNANDRANKATG